MDSCLLDSVCRRNFHFWILFNKTLGNVGLVWGFSNRSHFKRHDSENSEKENFKLGTTKKPPIMKTRFRILIFLGLIVNANLLFGQSSPLGIFSDQADIGNVAKPGSASFDSAKGEYLIAG